MCPVVGKHPCATHRRAGAQHTRGMHAQRARGTHPCPQSSIFSACPDHRLRRLRFVRSRWISPREVRAAALILGEYLGEYLGKSPTRRCELLRNLWVAPDRRRQAISAGLSGLGYLPRLFFSRLFISGMVP